MNINNSEKLLQNWNFWIAVHTPNCSHENAWEAICHIEEGSGDNLDQADRKAGYVDYIQYTICHANGKSDGGMLMLKTPYSEMPTERIIEEVLRFNDYPTDWSGLCVDILVDL